MTKSLGILGPSLGCCIKSNPEHLDYFKIQSFNRIRSGSNLYYSYENMQTQNSDDDSQG